MSLFWILAQQQQHQQQQQQQSGTSQFKPVQDMSEMTPKLTAQQILHQQMMNKKKALDMEKNKKAAAMKGTPDTSRERQDDQSAEPSSEDFWLSLQANSKIQASMSSILTPRLKELFLKSIKCLF